MRILFCNKYNHRFSGTEVYLFELMELLQSEGHEVALFSMADSRGRPTPYDHHFVPHIEFKGENSVLQKTRAALHAIYSQDARRRMGAMIEQFRPDIAHVRNIYHHLSPSILWELKAHKVPVIYHLNDFKLLCPSYNLVSQGEACEQCKGGKFFHVLPSSCYPGLSARMTLMAEAYVHKWLGTYRHCVDRFLAPSQFVRDKFVEHGWDAEKFEVLPHFQLMPVLVEPSPAPDNAPLLYFGRLSKEKGIEDLLWAMKGVPAMHLIIAGDGPQRGELKDLAKSLRLDNVEFIGPVCSTELKSLVAKSFFTVFPSHAYETLGKTILESYAEARAVVATDLGSRREIVRDGETGILYPTGDVERLIQSLKRFGSNPDLARKMGRAGWEMVQRRHAPQVHYQRLVNLYQQMVAEGDAKRVATQARQRYICFPQFAKSDQEKPLSATVAKAKLRIAFIGGRGVVSKYSGIEAYYEAVGERLAASGHEVTVYCRNHFTPPLADHNGMRLVRLPTVRSKHWETALHTILSTVHVLTQKCDIVHYHTLGPALFSFIPRLLGKKTVVTVQGLDWQRKKWGKLASAVLRLGEKASAKFPNGTIVVSQALQQRYRSQHGVETYCIPNGGVVRGRSKPKKIFGWGLEPGKYMLFLGRFSPEKGCHLLIDAYERLDLKDTNVKLVMAGAGSYCDDYSRVLRRHSSDKIKILDCVSGPVLDELLTNAMIFVLPSDLEGLSLALLDAMGAGLCVLTSDVPENREVVDGAGFTFQRGNALDLADKLHYLISNRSVRRAAGRAAKDRVLGQYQWARIAADIESAYFDILGPHTGTLPKKKSVSVERALDTAKIPARSAS